MATTIYAGVNLETMTCCSCGIAFAFADQAVTQRREDGKAFYCPNGHSLSFAKSTTDKLREQVAKLENEVARVKDDKAYFEKRLYTVQDEKEIVERTLKASKTRLRKTKERIAGGVCPCCNRTFENLSRHMKGQHPGFGKSE